MILFCNKEETVVYECSKSQLFVYISTFSVILMECFDIRFCLHVCTLSFDLLLVVPKVNIAI